MSDRYGGDVLAGDWRRPRKVRRVEIELTGDLVLEDPTSGFVGAVVRVERGTMELEDRFGRRRSFSVDDTFLMDGEPVRLGLPRMTQTGPGRTASGSLAVTDAEARVARAGRIYVEGRHDAELVEKVWGDDLRVEGVVVEPMEGVDHLASVIARFGPGPDRRLGVLVDHLVEGSKEQRLADAQRDPHVMVRGHRFVDIWAAVDPRRLGLAAWPDVPRGVDWKSGICAAVGVTDPARFWRELLGRVRS
ncbi:MAG TPA: DUF3097 family protein, partial [Nocardioidaceae bacterium]|nr:DUF3097 family protein [Nocardioidaceae bacterium]